MTTRPRIRLDYLVGALLLAIAESMIYGEVSTGAQDDLQRATDLVRHMIMQYGMSEVLGAAVPDVRTGPAYLGEMGGLTRREFSEETARRIDAETQRLLSEAEGRVQATLTERRHERDALASMLLRRETVERDVLVRLLTARSADAGAAAGAANAA